MGGKLNIDEQAIRRLAALLEETGLGEIEWSDAWGRRRLRVSRAATNGSVWAPAPVPPAPDVANATPVAAAAGRGIGVDANHPGAVTSPMVGTVYLAPEPGATPFVTAGSTVAAGDTLFIVEAMKTMNPVVAPRGGRVTHIYAQNAAPIEYGEVLAVIEA